MLAEDGRNGGISWDVSRARSTLHFDKIAGAWHVFFAQLSGHPDGIANAFVPVAIDAKGPTYTCTFHLFPVAKS